jgi:hypothetical protein
MLRTFAAAFVVLALTAGAWAEDKPIADLIKQLDADSFSERQAATTQLVERGKEAIDALKQAAASESAEASTRAFEILRKHLESKDAELKSAAKEALQKIAAGDNAAARRAKDILNPKIVSPSEQPTPRPAIGGGGIRVFGGGRIAIAGAAAGGGKRISVKEVDGVKEIEAVDGDRTVKINEDPGKSLKVKITEKKDGKEESQEYEAKNADELKEKHPEAFKAYEQWGKGGAGLGIADIRIEAVPGIAPALPIVPGAPIRVAPAAIIRDPKEITDRLDKAQAQLEDSLATLKKLAEKSDNAEDVRKAIDAIDAAKKALEEVKGKIPGGR